MHIASIVITEFMYLGGVNPYRKKLKCQDNEDEEKRRVTLSRKQRERTSNQK